MRLVLSVMCSLMMCGAVSASTDDGDGMEIVSAFQGLRMGGPGSAFRPYVKQNSTKVVLQTASASVVPVAVALAGNNQTLRTASDSAPTSASGTFNLKSFSFESSADNSIMPSASELAIGFSQKDQDLFNFGGDFFAGKSNNFSMGLTMSQKSGTKGKPPKIWPKRKNSKKFGRR